MLDGIGRSLVYVAWAIANLVIVGVAAGLDIFPNGLVAILAIMLLNYPAIVIHELGHAWIARRRGATVRKIVTLPFSYTPADQKFAVEDRVPAGGDIGGYVLFHFPGGKGTRADNVAISAAGPLANILTGALLLALLAAIHATPASGPPPATMEVVAEGLRAPGHEVESTNLPTDEQIAKMIREHENELQGEFLAKTADGILTLFGVISIILGVANLIPYQGSDGAMILRELRRR